MEKNTKKTTVISAIAVFFIIALSCRYLTNKTELLTNIDNSFVRTILQGIGPAIGAFIAAKIFHIQPIMSLKGNFANIFIPLSIYWLLTAVLIGTTAYFTKGGSVK